MEGFTRRNARGETLRKGENKATTEKSHEGGQKKKKSMNGRRRDGGVGESEVSVVLTLERLLSPPSSLAPDKEPDGD